MNYYSGGLAELVSHPTPLTYSFFAHWFTGATSFGAAMELLGLPYEKIPLPVVSLVDSQLFVNLDIEEHTLYHRTVFSYAPQTDTNQEPKPKLNPVKLLNPLCYPPTLRLLSKQSHWSAQPQDALSLAQKLLTDIPQGDVGTEIAKIDEVLTNSVWPSVVAIGTLTEFFHRLLVKNKNATDLFWNQVSAKVAKRDWFFNSLAAQSLVKKGEIPLDKYMEEYGLRADNDYELNCPRWKEIPEFLEERLSLTKFRTDSLPVVPELEDKSAATQVLIELQILRSEARKKTLFYINVLRQAIIAVVGTDETIGETTRENLIGGNKITPDSFIIPKQIPKREVSKLFTQGKGLPISPGDAEGLSKTITNNTTTIAEGTIGIFPNATPEFTMLYPQCSGIVFVSGGQTSHGSIVAREFGIPALLDGNAAEIPNGSHLSINGTKGTWRVL